MVRLLLVLALLLFALPAPAQQSTVLRKAQSAAQRGDWDLVQRETKGDHGTGGEAGAIYVLRAYAAMQKGDFAEAAASASLSINASPTLIQAWLLKSEALKAARKPTESIDVLEECVRQFPDSARATFALGVALAQVDRCEEAISPLEETMFRRPDNTAVVAQLAQCYSKAERYQEASDLYGRLIDMAPSQQQYRLAFVESLIRLEKYDSVISVVQPLIATSTPNPKALTALSFALQQLQRFPEAVDALERVTDIDSTNADAWYNLGSAQYNSELRQEAIRSFKTAVRLQPNLGQAWFNMALAYADDGFTEEGIRAFQRASVLLPDQASDCYGSIAILNRKAGNLDAAFKAHDRAIALSPDASKPYASKGHTYVEADQWEEGREFLEGALERFPADPEILYPLAKCYLRLGLLEEAEAIAADLDTRLPFYGSELRMMMRR